MNTRAIRLFSRIFFVLLLILPATSNAQVPLCGEGNGNGVWDSGDVFYLINHVFAGGPSPAKCPPAPVAKTGQSPCYNTAGTVIACAGTGQDGEKRQGVPWPNPRFTDNGDGTVTDNLTALVWLKNANCFALRTWANALTDANSLASGTCGLTDGSAAGTWRLPNRKELSSLIGDDFFFPALPNTGGTAQWVEGNAFSGVQNNYYWSSSTNVGAPWIGFGVYLNDGSVAGVAKTNAYGVWPVRGGQ